ncbi:MAG: DUF7108 domain-containing protein [Halohasta sp.]
MSEHELPAEAVEEATRLTKLARRVGDDEEADAYRRRRADLLADHGYTARVREDDETLVLYPDEWLDDGTVVLDRIEDTDRAVEIPLSAASGEDAWAEIEAHNAAIVEAIEAEYGAVHAANIRAFADFMGNHYLARVDEATAEQIQEFTREYFPRNAWPDKKQREVVETSLSYLDSVSDADCPRPASERR